MEMASFACETNSKLELPQVEFSGLDSARHDVKAWAMARAKVARALQNYGGFEAVYDRVGAQLRDDLLGRAVPELFAVPELETLHDPTKIPYHCAWLLNKGYPFHSLQLTADPNSLTAIQDYSDVIWPEGNSFFCNTAWKYARHMQELAQIVHRMIFESLGLTDHCDTHIESLTYSMRLSKYNEDPSLKKSKLVLPSHKDPNFISIISQHKLEGLEVETFDGHWIRVALKPHAFVVLLGESFLAWSNGRFKAPKHRVIMEGFEVRYSTIYSTFPSLRNSMVETPNELVDKERALLFNPFNYYEYLNFRFSDEGEKHEDTLKAYCGVEPLELAA